MIILFDIYSYLRDGQIFLYIFSYQFLMIMINYNFFNIFPKSAIHIHIQVLIILKLYLKVTSIEGSNFLYLSIKDQDNKY